MADNTDEEHLDNPTNAQSENPLDKIIPPAETKTKNPNQEIENMEVHHHPDLHHKPKKWKEYFLEFLMIFLAVTLVFFAENIREHFTDKEKAKQSIETIITAIASDTSQLNDIIASNRLSLSFLTKFVKLRGSDFSENKTKREFYEDVANGAYNDACFRNNDAAFQQLQTSGTLRLISKQGILDSLFEYQHKTNLILRLEPDHYYFTKNVWEEMHNLMDVSFALRSFDSANFNFKAIALDYKVPEDTKTVLNDDKRMMVKLFNDATLLTLCSEIYIGLLEQQLVYGKRLIGLLKKEYNLD
jgi:hypothetical protein